MNHSRLYKISIDFYMIIWLYLYKILTNSKYIQMNTKKTKETIVIFAFKVENIYWVMKCMLQHTACQYVGSDSKEVLRWLKNLTHGQTSKHKMKKFASLRRRFQSFKIFFIPRDQSTAADSLYRIARSFHCDLVFDDCFISV